MQLVFAVIVVALGLTILAGHDRIMKGAAGALRYAPAWLRRTIFGDHIMIVAVVFFGIVLAVMTRIFGPG